MPKQRENDDVNLLKHFRVLANLTQEEAAGRVGVSRTLWSAWEGKNRPMSVAQLNAISKALDLDNSMKIDLIDWWGESCFAAVDQE